VRFLLAASLALFGIVSVTAPAGAAGTEERIRLLETQLQQMQQELQNLRKEADREREEAKRAQEATKKAQQEQERKTDVVAEAIDTLKSSLTIPEEMKLEGKYGLAPAAAKVYGRERGLSIGGYGEVVFRVPTSEKVQTAGGVTVDQARTDMQRLILYTGYKFNDWIVFNSELEFEHGATDPTITQGSGGEVEVEFAYIDFFLRDYVNVRSGLVLAPMGIINEVHEPVAFFGVDRPLVDPPIIPSPWREVGGGLFGEPFPGFEYRLYAYDGFNAVGFRPAGLRGGRQKGSRALANDWAFIGRADYEPTEGLLVGTSVYSGNSGQGQTIESESGEGVAIPGTLTTIWEAHGQYRWRGLEARGEVAMAWLGDSKQLTEALRELGEIGSSDTIASEMLGMYVEVGYDVLQWVLEDTEQQFLPFFRYEYNNTQLRTPSGEDFQPNDFFEDRIWTIGVNYKPIPQVVLKADYRDWNPVTGEKADTVDFGLGFVF